MGELILIRPALEESAISAVLGDPERFLEQAYRWRAAYFGDARCIPIAKAVEACLERALLPNEANVRVQLQAAGMWETAVKPVFLAELDNRGTSQVVAGLGSYLDQMVVLWQARTARGQALRFADEVADDPYNMASLASGLTQDVNRVIAAETREDEAEPTLAAALATPRQEAVAKYGCGLAWLNARLGGLVPSEVTGIKGRYKGRKTTLAAFMALRAFLSGASVAWYTTADGTWLSLFDRWTAILATGYMVTAGVAPEHWTLKPKYLDKAMRSPAQQWAIEKAQRRLLADDGGTRVRSYDVGRHRVHELPNLVARIRRDHARRATDLVVIDYLQAITDADDPSEYEILRRATKQLLAVNQELGMHSIWLMQKNEDSNKSGGGRSAGVRGGSQAPAAVDTLLEPWYNEARPAEFGVQIWTARYAGQEAFRYVIEPNSGCILNAQDMPERAEPVLAQSQEEEGPEVYDDERAVEVAAAA